MHHIFFAAAIVLAAIRLIQVLGVGVMLLRR